VFGREGFVRLTVVTAYSDDFGTEIPEFLVRVSELASFRGASPSEIFWIEVYDYVLLSSEIFEANVVTIAGLKSELRGPTAYC
jgi:hypothetical protein